jgi:UDP-N-acetyl-D-mannosaminuronate dehydrogenase
MKIGFIGLGTMGLPMAQNIVRGGHDVTGFDLASSAVAELVATGGTAAASPAEAALDADIVIGSIGIKVREVPQECSCFRSLWICGTTDQFGAFREVSALIAS